MKSDNFDFPFLEMSIVLMERKFFTVKKVKFQENGWENLIEYWALFELT